MFLDGNNYKRQLWNLPTETATTYAHRCTPFVLPSNGVLSLEDSVITLTTNVVFRPQCTGSGVSDVSTIADLKDPFYASTIPQTYVVAAATVIAWILVIMLIITPRTNFLGNSGTAPGFSSGHGIIGGATGGGTNLIGVGSRPWLQKAAALTVAISLTIATADTFECAENQYVNGYMDATRLRDEVLGSLEIRITRVISDVFLWLAQVQTLIRLFPRHKEKVLIKWIGFALILFDSLFSCLNSFMIKSTHRPGQFVDAIPALSYLFELALALLYAAWVIYYSLTKRRYAFYHSKMPSISLIASLSLVAVLTPVVFFVTDVSNPDVAGWGDYFRWVGAAAASVVVWEWVERIEALERDEKKDGILGREIFDGDEMLDVTPSDDVVWTDVRRGRTRYRRNEKDGDGNDSGDNQLSAAERGLGGMARRLWFRRNKPEQNGDRRPAPPHPPTIAQEAENGTKTNGQNGIAFSSLPKPGRQNDESILGGPTPPPAVASPVSRTDTTSAASTVYVIQSNPLADVPQPVRRRVDANGYAARALAQVNEERSQARDPEKEEPEENSKTNQGRGNGAWYAVSNPFKRKRASPPAEVQQARQMLSSTIARGTTPVHNFSPWDIRNRIGVLAAETGEKLRDKKAARNRRQLDNLPVTIIPAQPRGSERTWTPPNSTLRDSIAQTREGVQSNENSPSHGASGSTTLTTSSQPAPTSSQQDPASAEADETGRRHSTGMASPNVTTLSNQVVNPRHSHGDEPNAVTGRSSPSGTSMQRRSMRSSPLATYHASASSPSDAADSGGDHDYG